MRQFIFSQNDSGNEAHTSRTQAQASSSRIHSLFYSDSGRVHENSTAQPPASVGRITFEQNSVGTEKDNEDASSNAMRANKILYSSQLIPLGHCENSSSNSANAYSIQSQRQPASLHPHIRPRSDTFNTNHFSDKSIPSASFQKLCKHPENKHSIFVNPALSSDSEDEQVISQVEKIKSAAMSLQQISHFPPIINEKVVSLPRLESIHPPPVPAVDSREPFIDTHRASPLQANVSFPSSSFQGRHHILLGEQARSQNLQNNEVSLNGERLIAVAGPSTANASNQSIHRSSILPNRTVASHSVSIRPSTSRSNISRNVSSKRGSSEVIHACTGSNEGNSNTIYTGTTNARVNQDIRNNTRGVSPDSSCVVSSSTEPCSAAGGSNEEALVQSADRQHMAPVLLDSVVDSTGDPLLLDDDSISGNDNNCSEFISSLTKYNKLIPCSFMMQHQSIDSFRQQHDNSDSSDDDTDLLKGSLPHHFDLMTTKQSSSNVHHDIVKEILLKPVKHDYHPKVYRSSHNILQLKNVPKTGSVSVSISYILKKF